MRKLYLLLSFIIFSFSLHAQNDFFILKRHDKTVHQYFEDAYINCELIDQSWIEGTIKAVRNDSVFIQPFHVNYLPTIWGTLMPDTVKQSTIKFPLKDIYAFPAKDDKVHGVPSPQLISTALQVGGAGYDALNVINNLGSRSPVFASSNIPRLVGGAVAFIAGKIIQKICCPTLLIIGKKYHIEYMGNTSSQ